MFNFILIPLLSLNLFAESSTSSKGELRLESRFFTNDDLSQTQDLGYGLAGRLEVDNSWNELQSRIQIFSRVDHKDTTRQRLNIEELYTQWVMEEWVLFTGFKTLNWSTAEAFHPSDIINSRNFDGPLENAEKVGELMLGFQYLSELFNISAFYMPTLTRPQLPAQSNRLSFAPTGINVGEVQFVDNDGNIKETDELVEQWALRFQLPLDSWEFNFYWVHHYDRTDLRSALNVNTGQIAPLLNQVDHYALSFQYVWESWIFKSENVYRDFKENIFISDFANTISRQDYAMSSLALEYLWSHDSGSDTTIIFEFQELYGVDENFRYAINPFQRDALLGVRHSFNDVDGKEFFAAIIADVERSKEILASISYSQRLSDVWKVKFGARYIDAPQSSALDITGMRALNNDHQLDISLSRFF